MSDLRGTEKIGIKAIGLLAGAIFVLGGCHSSEPRSASPVTDACDVLTPVEVSSVIGVPIAAGKHIPASSTVMCAWSENGASDESATKVVLNYATLPYFDKEKAATGNVLVTPASGVGDDAFFVTSDFGSSLFVRKGNTAIGFSVRDRSLPADKVMAQERALGVKAAARL